MLFSAISGGSPLCHVGVAPTLSIPRVTAVPPRRTALSLRDNRRWWDGDNRYFDSDAGRETPDKTLRRSSLITQEMEDEVLASAVERVDFNTVSRAVSSLIDGDAERGDGRRSRTENSVARSSSSPGNQGQNSWSAQQIAVASGAVTFLLSPLLVPIVHSLLPPIIPSPSSLSVTGAALLGTLAYIAALGDPADESNVISAGARGVLGDGAEVGGAVSRLVGRAALQSARSSAPRLRAAARAAVDYEGAATTRERLAELEAENEALRGEVALWRAVEDVASMYKLEGEARPAAAGGAGRRPVARLSRSSRPFRPPPRRAEGDDPVRRNQGVVARRQELAATEAGPEGNTEVGPGSVPLAPGCPLAAAGSGEPPFRSSSARTTAFARPAGSPRRIAPLFECH